MARASLVAIFTVGLAWLVSAQTISLRTIGVTDAEAADAIVSALATGAIGSAGRSAFKAADADERVRLVRGVVTFARAFTGSADFAQRYAILRASQRPAPPAVPRTGDEARAEQLRQIALAVAEAQQTAAKAPASVRNQLEAEIEAMKRQVEELHADPDYRATLDAAVREEAARADAEYQDALRAFEETLPASARTLVARRLRRFLDVCAAVDYSAPLQQDADRTWRFVDPALEGRPSEWKLCYRAGKPAVDAARRAAEEWLKDLVQ
jgi:hypothetical protein